MVYKLCFGSVVLALLLSVPEKTWAQTPNWLWAQAIGGTGFDIGKSIAVDKESGDVYTAGYFELTADFDTGPGIFSLTTANYGAFISKTDSEGNFIWSKGFSGTGSSSADAIALDQGNGNIYTMGEFSGTIDFDPGPDIHNVTSDGDQSLFILKLNRKGEFIWVRIIVGASNESTNSIALDLSGSGDIYIASNFRQTIDIDSSTEILNITKVGYEDVFITRLDSLGHFLWARSIGGPTSSVITKSIAFDPSIDGGVYYTGHFYGTIDFNPGEEVHNITATGSHDVFISKLDRHGDFAWAKSMQGKDNGSWASGTSIVIDPSENGGIYTTGDFWETTDFNPGHGTCKLTGGGIFISKLDSHGQFIWAKSFKGTDGYESGNSIAIDDSNGDIYITGLFMGKVDFDPGSGKFNINSVGLINAFLSILDHSGNFIWVKTMSGGLKPRACAGQSVALDHAGNAYLTGYFNSAAFAFDSIIVENADGKDPAQDGITMDIFIAKLGRVSPLPDKDSKSLHMTVSPSPTKDKLKIEYDNVDLHKALITVFNMAGEVMFSVPNEEMENKVTIDISHLASGIYFIRLEMNGSRMTKKVFKE